MLKIKKGDAVVVKKGKDRGRQGVVLAIKGIRLLVEGINLIKKHTKATQDKPGGIVEKEALISASNVAILNQATGKSDRVGFKVLEDGRKVRVFKSTGEVVDI